MFGFFNRKNKSIKVNEIDDILKHINLIDVRSSEEFKAKSIKKSKNIPMQELVKNPEKYLNKEKEYHIICASGGRSTMTCNSLRKKGYSVINVAGGVGGYSGKNIMIK